MHAYKTFVSYYNSIYSSAAMQPLIDAPMGTYTSEDFRDAWIELNWVDHWRDEALEYACFVEWKLDMLNITDNLISVYKSF